MKNRLPAYALFLLTGLSIWMACSKPTAFGSGLLENAVADYDFTDTLTVRCTLLREDSVPSADVTSTASYFLCGELNDPFFGKSSSEVYTLIRQSYLNPPFNAGNYSKYHLDSIVMYLEVAPAGVYGDTTAQQTIHVSQLHDVLDYTKSYYSNATLTTDNEIGSATYTPRPNHTDSLFSTTTKAAFIRIPLHNDYANMLMQIDSLNTISDSNFYRIVHGLKITTTTNGGSPGAMMAFNMNDQSFSLIRLYYKYDTISTQSTFDYYYGGNKFTHYTHDYSGTPIAQKIGKPVDDLMYAQAMCGLKLKVEIPYCDTFYNKMKGVAVNEAKLALSAFNQSGDSPWLTPASQMIFTQPQGDTTFVFTSDVLYSLGTALNGGFAQFGGFPLAETHGGVAISRYNMLMNDRMQKMMNGKLGKTVYINVYTQNRSAMRVILGGPKNATFPAKLRLKYTKL